MKLFPSRRVWRYGLAEAVAPRPDDPLEENVTKHRNLIGMALCCVLALGAVPLVYGPAAHAAPKKAKSRKVQGKWKLRGWNMGSKPENKEDYTGEVIVKAKGKNTFLVEWKIGGKIVNTGVGLYDPKSDSFAAGYAIGGSAGCAIWNFSEDGKTMMCTGTFQKKLGQVAHEEWTR